MSNNIGGIRFCPECQNMMKPLEERKLTFICRCCEYKDYIEEPKDTDEYLISRKDIKAQKQNILNDPEYASDPTMMRTQDTCCPLCDYNEAVFFMTTDQSESKINKVYICCRTERGQIICGHSWQTDKLV